MQRPIDPNCANARRRVTGIRGPLPAPCRVARWIIGLSLGIALLGLGLVGMDQLTADPRPESQTGLWMTRFQLATPALWPAGTPQRHPATVHPGVNLQYCAGMEARR